MSDDEYRFLTVRHLPFRLTGEEAAYLLRCQAHDIKTLVQARLLKPLGDPPKNGKKMFRTKDILELANDPKWLHKMTNAIHDFWHENNSGRKKDSSGLSDDALAA